jgi:hypothetical protein
MSKRMMLDTCLASVKDLLGCVEGISWHDRASMAAWISFSFPSFLPFFLPSFLLPFLHS